MNTYFIMGRYTRDALRQIDHSRTMEVVGIIEEQDGQIVDMFAMLGPYDIALIVKLANNVAAAETSVRLTETTGIQFETWPAIGVERFDEMISKHKQQRAPQEKMI